MKATKGRYISQNGQRLAVEGRCGSEWPIPKFAFATCIGFGGDRGPEVPNQNPFTCWNLGNQWTAPLIITIPPSETHYGQKTKHQRMDCNFRAEADADVAMRGFMWI